MSALVNIPTLLLNVSRLRRVPHLTQEIVQGAPSFSSGDMAHTAQTPPTRNTVPVANADTATTTENGGVIETDRSAHGVLIFLHR